MAQQATPGTDPTLVPQPTSGGGMRGLGESFEPDLNTGTGNYRVPLWSPRGPNQFAPEINLTYSTGFGNDAFGLGWNLDLLKVTRNSDFGVPTYRDAEDRFYLAHEELAEVEPGVYRHLREERFLRAERQGEGWLVRTRAGFTYRLGVTPEGRETVNIGGREATFAWMIEEALDANGNRIQYNYLRDGGRLYLLEIQYGIYRIEFEYESRPDIIANARRGAEVSTSLRCQRIQYFIDSLQVLPVRVYALNYQQENYSEISLLTSVEMTGLRVTPDGEERQSAPRLQFAYTEFDPSSRRYQSFDTVGAAPPPLSVAQPDTELVDVLGDGLPDVVELSGRDCLWWQNLGDGRWAAPRTLPNLPAPIQLGARNVAFADLTGTATADVLNLEDAPFGIYLNKAGSGWTKRHVYRRRPPFDLSDRELRLVDLDGDGRVDAIRSGGRFFYLYYNRFGENGSGGGEWTSATAVSRVRDRGIWPDVSFSDRRVQLADLTGDGLVDIAQVYAGQIDYWPYFGNGRWGERHTLFLPDMPQRNIDPERFFISDVNGDGVADFIYVGLDRVYLWINRGGNSVSPRIEVVFTPSAAGASIRLADLYGSGTRGVLWTYPFSRVNQHNYKYLDFTGGVKPYLLNRIEHGTGKITEIHYRSSASYAREAEESRNPWDTALPFSLQVVSDIIEQDELTGSTRHRYFVYRDGNFDGEQRRFTGFGQAETIEVGDATIPSRRTMTIFEQGLGLPSNQAAVLARRPIRLEIYGLDGSSVEADPFRIEESEWQVETVATALDGRPILHGRLVRSVIREFEREATSHVRITQLRYNSFGNITEKLEQFGEGADVQTIRTQINYAINEARWLLDRQSEVIRTNQAGDLLGLQRFYYDGPDFEGLPAGQVEKGNVTHNEELVLTSAIALDAYGVDQPDWSALGYKEMSLPDGSTGWGVDAVRRRFDSRGNLIATRNPLGHEAQIDYDAEGIYPVATRNALNQETQLLYDPIAEYPTSMRDPNGSVVITRFDALGRTVAQICPGDTKEFPSVTLEYLDTTLPLGVISRSRVIAGEAETITQASYYDGEGRLLQQRTQVPGGKISVVPTPGYNARGYEQTRPIPFLSEGGLEFSAEGDGSLGALEFQYDAMSRVIRAIAADGGIARAVYKLGESDQFSVDDTDDSPENIARGHFNTPTTEQYDIRGRLIAVIERDASSEQITRYTYDDNDNLTSITDPRGFVVAQYINDFNGRKLVVEHVDAGTHRALYDASGQRVRRISPRNQTVETSYDSTGRVTDVAIDGSVVEHFTYDTGRGSNLIMRLAQVEDASGITDFSYDSRGRITSRSISVDGETYEFQYEYDAANRFTTVRYPHGEAVQYEYDTSMLVQIPGVIDNIEYAPLGQVKCISFANGVVQEYEHDPVSLRVNMMAVRLPGELDSVVSRAYEYDRIGNPLRITNQNAEIQTYAYDAFNRLTVTNGAADGQPFTEAFAYDAAGNFTRNDGFHSGTLITTPGTNQITGVNSDGADETLFTYNLEGQITSAPGRTFTFDARGRLTSAQTDAGLRLDFSYTYDGRRARTLQTVDGETQTTLHLQPDYEIYNGEPTLHVGINGQRIASLKSGGRRRYYHADYRGDVLAVTNEAGMTVTITSYRPFGAVHRRTGEDSELGFLGVEVEAAIGLIQLGTRWYDPKLGRFISPDHFLLFEPERVLKSPQALNLYVYVVNNPMVLTDLTGQTPDWWHWLVGGLIIAALVAATIIVGIFTGGAGFAFGILLFASIGSVLGGGLGVSTAIARGGDPAKGFLFGVIAGGAAGALGYAAGAGMAALVGTSSFWGGVAASAASGAFQGLGAGAIFGYSGGVGTFEDVLINAAIGFGVGAVAGGIFGSIGAGELINYQEFQEFIVSTLGASSLSPAMQTALAASVLTWINAYVFYVPLADAWRIDSESGVVGESRSPLVQSLSLRSATSNLSPASPLLTNSSVSYTQPFYYKQVAGTEVDVSITFNVRRIDRAIREELVNPARAARGEAGR